MSYFKPYLKPVVLVIAYQVSVTIMLGLFIYAGGSNFTGVMSAVMGEQTSSSGAFTFTLPVVMPELTDLKLPYLFIPENNAGWEWWLVPVTVLTGLVQSFLHGMYLGGIDAAMRGREDVPLLRIGRYYFKRMLIWSVVMLILGVLVLLLTAAFWPLGILGLIALLLYSLTPYLIVVRDEPVMEAMAMAPSHLWRTVPLALAALAGTAILSLFTMLPQPWNYGVTLVLYSAAGTLLIAWLMRRLDDESPDRRDSAEDRWMETGQHEQARPAEEGIPFRREPRRAFLLALIPLLAAIGMWAAEGRHLILLDQILMRPKTEMGGTAYVARFSDVYRATGQQTSTYDWPQGTANLTMKLPGLSGDKTPRSISGIATVEWEANEGSFLSRNNVKDQSRGASKVTSQIWYRLSRQTAADGSIYYSSAFNGSAVFVGTPAPFREPMSLVMTVSGDGSHVFLYRYPERFHREQGYFDLRMSDDGQYMVPQASEVNPDDFRLFWFAAEPGPSQVFEMLAAKNKTSIPDLDYSPYLPLAAAMLEADGEQVLLALDLLRNTGVELEVPDWQAGQWSDYLRSLYAEADFDETLTYIAAAGRQGFDNSRPLTAEEAAEQTGVTGDDGIAFYEMTIAFPAGEVPLLYGMAEDGRVVSIRLQGLN